MADAEECWRHWATPHGRALHRPRAEPKGFERAAAAGCNEIGMAVVASDTFNRRNQGVSTDESIAPGSHCTRRGAGRDPCPGHRLAAFGCPFEGEVPVDRVVEIAKRVADARRSRSRSPIRSVSASRRRCRVIERVREPCRHAAALPFSQHPQHRLANAYARCRRACTRSTRAWAGSAVSVCAGGDRQHPTEDLVIMLQRSGTGPGVSLDARSQPASGCSEQLGRAACRGMLVEGGLTIRRGRACGAPAADQGDEGPAATMHNR
jgi:hydroxymethylglutaryl-CoA lyase